MPEPRVLGGIFRERGPVTLVALVSNAARTGQILQGSLTTWALHVYDPDDPTNPDTVKWSLTGQLNTVGWQASVNTTGYKRECPEGYSFLYTIGHDESDSQGTPVDFDAITVGAGRLRIELETFDAGGDKTVDGAIAATWLLTLEGRITGPSV